MVGMRTQPQKLTRRCEVTPFLLCTVFQGNLNPEVEEGICQVLSYLRLESEVLPGSKNIPSTLYASSSTSSSLLQKKEENPGLRISWGSFFMYKIAHNASPAYGGGFRAANAAVNK
ncbi:hypothetical protein ACOSQ2_032833 [Xanthoceras sorbifolium]